MPNCSGQIRICRQEINWETNTDEISLERSAVLRRQWIDLCLAADPTNILRQGYGLKLGSFISADKGARVTL
jgi:hypothetical protein